MFGGPAFGGACAVVVGPDDLVLEAGASEDLVEQHFAVVDFAWVDMEEEGAGGGEDAVGFLESGADKAEEIVEGVGVAGEGVGGDFCAVACSSEAGAVACLVADGLEAGGGFAGVRY